MNVNNHTIEKIREYFIGLTELGILYSKLKCLDWNISIFPDLINKMIRLGYLDSNENITPKGELVVANCLITESELSTQDKFGEIWEIFPRDDGFRNFPKTRMIRYNKAKTQADYINALKEYPHETLLQALKNEISFRQRNTSTENMMKYMKGSHNWFETKAYENFLDNISEDDVNTYGKELS